jgi:galactokinase
VIHVREEERARRLVAAPALGSRAELGEAVELSKSKVAAELDRLVELAYSNGAVAARMTGGGFGGAIVALVDRTDAHTFAERVVRDYGSRGRAYVCRASDGARELHPDAL